LQVVGQQLRVLLDYLVVVAVAVEDWPLARLLVPEEQAEEEQFFQAVVAVVVPRQQLVVEVLLLKEVEPEIALDLAPLEDQDLVVVGLEVLWELQEEVRLLMENWGLVDY
jgi:hypothetical protein